MKRKGTASFVELERALSGWLIELYVVQEGKGYLKKIGNSFVERVFYLKPQPARMLVVKAKIYDLGGPELFI